ncbi:MAG: hypothetical protein ACTHN5_21500 [Phycisphaerae bacterium]
MKTVPPDYQQLFQMWLEFVSEMANAAASAGTADPVEAARQMRDAYFQVLSRQIDEYFRSPQFLEMMKQSTETAIALQKQANDFFEQSHHSIGGVARQDVDSLMMAVRRCETRVLDKLEGISRRLDDLEGEAAKAASENGKSSRRSS